MLAANSQFRKAWDSGRGAALKHLDLWFAQNITVEYEQKKCIFGSTVDCASGYVSFYTGALDPPAAAAMEKLGLRDHDLVYAVNSQKTKGMKAQEVTGLMQREGWPQEITARREMIVDFSSEAQTIIVHEVIRGQVDTEDQNLQEVATFTTGDVASLMGSAGPAPEDGGAAEEIPLEAAAPDPSALDPAAVAAIQAKGGTVSGCAFCGSVFASQEAASSHAQDRHSVVDEEHSLEVVQTPSPEL